jgi:hypothetical protein
LHPLSGPLQPGLRFLRDPLPATDAPDFTTRLVPPRSATLLRVYPVPCDEHESGGLHLSADDRLVSVSPPSRETSGRIPFWSEPVSRFGSSRLDGIYQWFTYVGPLTQPCASSGFRLPESRGGPSRAPRTREGWLRCRCARHETVAGPALHLGYWRLNAKLHAGSRLSNNSSHGLRRANNPTPVLPRPTVLRPYSIRLSPDHATPKGRNSRAAFPHLIDARRISGVAGPAGRTRLSGRTLGKLPFCH